MARLIVIALAVVVLVILGLQNLSPSLALVVLGMRTVTLPLALWLLGAIAVGAICALLIFGLASVGQPPRSSYRPMGRRVPYPGDSGPTAASWAGSADTPTGIPADAAVDTSSQFAAKRTAAQPSPPEQSSPAQSHDQADWDSFRPPERWDSWEQPQPSNRVKPSQTESRSERGGFFSPGRRGYSAEDSVSEIEQGWGEDSADYRSSPDELESGWETFENGIADDDLEQRPRRAYRDSLYEADDTDPDDSGYDRSDYGDSGYEDLDDRSSPDWERETSEPSDRPEGTEIGPDGVYDADYRVIVPPFRPLDEESP